MARSHLNADINFKVRNVTAYRRKNSTVTDVKTLLQSSAMFMSMFCSTYKIYTDTTWYGKKIMELLWHHILHCEHKNKIYWLKYQNTHGNILLCQFRCMVRCKKQKSSNSRFISYNFTQTMEIEFQRIINGKTRKDRITDMTFAEVTFQYLLTELEEKWLQQLNHVKNRLYRDTERDTRMNT